LPPEDFPDYEYYYDDEPEEISFVAFYSALNGHRTNSSPFIIENLEDFLYAAIAVFT